MYGLTETHGQCLTSVQKPEYAALGAEEQARLLSAAATQCGGGPGVGAKEHRASDGLSALTRAANRRRRADAIAKDW